MNSGTPMARAASAPSSLQACTYRLDASPSGTRRSRSFILRVHHHVTEPATPMACAAPAPPSLQARANHHDASSSDTRCRHSRTLRVHHHGGHAENMRCFRTITSPSACQPPRRDPFRHPRLLQLPFACSPTRQPRRWRALPPHLNTSKRVRPDSTLTYLLPSAAVAPPCVFTDTSATPMALPLHLLLSKCVPPDMRPARPAPAEAAASSCVFTSTSATPMACAAPAPSSLQACATRLDASLPGTRCCRGFILQVHQHVSRADGVRYLRAPICSRAGHPTRRQPVRPP